MQKYIITLLVDGKELPMAVKVSTPIQAESKVASYRYDKVISIETKEEYKLRNKPFNHVMTSSYQNTKTSKSNPRS